MSSCPRILSKDRAEEHGEPLVWVDGPHADEGDDEVKQGLDGERLR
jgi:hypothetical protein